MVSKDLEKILKRPRVSTDELIEQRENCSISEIFSKKGEVYFRSVESEVVNELSQESGLIIDCGGGVILNPENIKRLKQQGIMINLSITADSVLQNIQGRNHRPLLDVEDPRAKIEELLEIRKPFYAEADYSVISDNKSVADLTQDVLKVIKDAES